MICLIQWFVIVKIRFFSIIISIDSLKWPLHKRKQNNYLVPFTPSFKGSDNDDRVMSLQHFRDVLLTNQFADKTIRWQDDKIATASINAIIWQVSAKCLVIKITCQPNVLSVNWFVSETSSYPAAFSQRHHPGCPGKNARPAECDNVPNHTTLPSISTKQIHSFTRDNLHRRGALSNLQCDSFRKYKHPVTKRCIIKTATFNHILRSFRHLT